MLPHSVSNTALKAADGEAILELEFHFEVHAAAALPMASKRQAPVRSRNGPCVRRMSNLRVLSERVARREFRLQDPMGDFQHGDALGRRNIVDANRDTPGQELGIARHIIHQGKHLCGRKGDQGAALNYLHSRIVRQKRGRRHRTMGSIAKR